MALHDMTVQPTDKAFICRHKNGNARVLYASDRSTCQRMVQTMAETNSWWEDITIESGSL